MRKFYVYVLFDPDYGFPIYVGKGCKYRITAHRSDFRCNAQKADFMRRAAERGVDIPAVKVGENLTEFEAFGVEIALIAAIGRAPCGPLMNGDDGGRGGRNPSPEARAKIAAAVSKAKKGRKHRPETIERMRTAAAGRVISKENLAKMHAAARVSPKVKAIAAALGSAKKGVAHKPEHTAKIKAALSGRGPSPQTIAARKANAAARRASKPRIQCAGCGEEFLPRRSAQIFCGMKCSGKANSARRGVVCNGHQRCNEHA